MEQDTDFLQEMEQLLDQHDYALPEVGDIRDGIIVSITPQGVIVDLGLKRDGIIQPADLDKLSEQERSSLQINDEIAVYILNTDQQDSLIVSRHMALLNQDWLRAQELLESSEIFEAEVVGYNRGGALVAFGGLRGFIPASHLSMLSPNMGDRQRQQRLSKLRGENVRLKVIEVDRRRRRLVLSQRDAEKVWQEERRRELMEELKGGDILTGRVSGWRDFGAFVDLGGVDGLVHVSELAWHRVEHPRDVVEIGEEVEVYVLKVDRDRQRISLSRKRLLPNPWSFVEDKYQVGDLVEGRIIRIVDYGAFVELEPGVEGLLHVSQLSRSTVQHPQEVVQEGELHLLRIISVDADRERIGLSLKAVRAQEQIEWMSQKELEAEEAARAEAEAAAEEAETEEETTELAQAEVEEIESEPAVAAEEAEVEEEATELAQAEVESEPAAAVEEAEVEEEATELAQAEVEEIESEPAAAAEEAEVEEEATELAQAEVESEPAVAEITVAEEAGETTEETVVEAELPVAADGDVETAEAAAESEPAAADEDEEVEDEEMETSEA